MWEFVKELFDHESIIKFGGLTLLLVVIFAETGLFIGFFLPGDSLVFLSGLICRTKPYLLNDISFPLLLLSLVAAAVLGNMTGYWFGRRVGPALFKREDSFLFKKSHLVTTRAFYDRYGGRTLIMGRFLPIIRTFAPILAGVIKVDAGKFMLYNLAGAVAWICSISVTGYFLGTNEWVNNNVGYIILFLIIITMIPVLLTWLKERKKRKAEGKAG